MSDIFILAPDPNGECCDCSTRMSPCDSCGCNFNIPIKNTFYIPPGVTPKTVTLSTQSDAQTYIDTYTDNCQVYISDSDSLGTPGGGYILGVVSSMAVSFSSNIFYLFTQIDSALPNFPLDLFYVNFNLLSGSYLRFDYFGPLSTGTDFSMGLFDSGGTQLVPFQSPTNPPGFPTPVPGWNIVSYYGWLIPSDGVYQFKVATFSAINRDFAFSSSKTQSICRPRALYNGTQYLNCTTL